MYFSFFVLVIFSGMPLPVGFEQFPERQVEHPCSADSGLFRGGDLMLTSTSGSDFGHRFDNPKDSEGRSGVQIQNSATGRSLVSFQLPSTEV